MEKLGLFVEYFLEMLGKILKAVNVLASDSNMLEDIGDAVAAFGDNVDSLK